MFSLIEFVGIIAVIYLLIRNTSRISRLEELVKKNVVIQNAPVSVPNKTTQEDSPLVASTDAENPSSMLREVNHGLETKPKENEESSGRLLGGLGIAAVLIGIAFFLKYAFDSNMIGVTGRIMLGIISGIGFLVVGQLLRNKYIKYSDLLMGGGSAILYLSVFSAYAFYGLISASTAGILMFCITFLTLAISVVNATITLSLVGVIGAFATPFLVGFREDTMITLFVYMTIINLGVLGISFFKKWLHLNLVTFIGTAINFIAWFGVYYREDALFPVIGFCFVTFLIFIVANIARVIVAGVKADQADYLLLGANAFAFAFIGYTVLEPTYSGILGFAAVFISAIYIGIAFIVNKSNPSDRALNIFLPGLAVTFLSLAVPLQFSGPWIAVAWLIEAVILYGIASIINNRGFQIMGVLVYALGLLNFMSWHMSHIREIDFVPVFNTSFIVLLLAVIVAYIIAYVYRRYGSITVEIQKRGIMVFVVIANILSIYAISSQIDFYHTSKIINLSREYQESLADGNRYNTGYDNTDASRTLSANYYQTSSSIKNQSNTLISIVWTLYAAILIGLGFARRISSLRRLGLILFLITAVKVFVDMWSLGQLYRIISFIAFGIVALIVSFGYAKYKDRLKEII